MIPKRELIERLAVAESKLSKLYRYIPSLEYMVENEAVMASMGFSLSEIGEVFRKGSGYKRGSLIDPYTGEELPIHLVCATIQKNPYTEHYEVYLNNQPYKDFIDSIKVRSVYLNQLAREHVEVAELMKENERLREIISHLSK
jgi:hypothetical protein